MDPIATKDGSALKGYYVDRRVSYDNLPVNFVNGKKNIRKKLFAGGVLLNYPGHEPGYWTRKYGKTMSATSALRLDISPYDEQGRTRVIITIQWADHGDEGGFGMENDPEITLYSTLDEEGNYLHPYRLHELSY